MKRTIISEQAKGWPIGPWNSSAPYAVGWARQPRDEIHLHEHVSETYIVVQGSGTLVIGAERLSVGAGEVIFIEPGEYHGWVDSSPDFLMLMVHYPVDPADKVPLSAGE